MCPRPGCGVTPGTRLAQLGDAVRYVRAHGVRRVARKLRRLYLFNRERIYLTRGSLETAARRSLGPAGVEVRLVQPEDASRLLAFRHISPQTVRTWLGPDHRVVLALKDGMPAGYRWLSRRVTPSLAPVLTLEPDELFSVMAFVAPAFRRQGIHDDLVIGTGHLLRPAGFRHTWGSQAATNHAMQQVLLRPTYISRYVGTLTRQSSLGRVRFSFLPTTQLTVERVAGAVQLLAPLCGRVRRLSVLLHPVSVAVPPDAIDRVRAALGIDLRITSVSETARQAEAFAGAVERIAADRPDALFILYDTMFAEHRRTLTALVGARSLPALYEGTIFAAAGGLLACSAPAPCLDALPESLRRIAIRPEAPAS